MIVPLAEEHASQVARLHCDNLTGLLTRLGYRATVAHYRACAATPLATAFVFLDQGRVEGFVAGAANPARLKREIPRRKPWSVLTGLLAGLLRRPSAALDLFQNLARPPAAAYDPEAPELTYLAVSAQARRAGVGRELVEAFARSLAARGVEAFELSVDSDNQGAVRFYEKMGFVPLGEYREFSTLHRRYRLRL